MSQSWNTQGMDKRLKGGTTADLSDQGMLSTIGSGLQLLTGGLSNGGGFGGALGGGGQQPDLGPSSYDIDEEGSDGDENEFDSDDEVEVDLGRDQAEESGDDLDAEDGLFNPSELLGRTGVFGSQGSRRKAFRCDIHSVRITNIARRRRDVQVIMTLGAAHGQGSADAAKSIEARSTEGTQNGEAPNDGPEGDDAPSDERANSHGKGRQMWKKVANKVAVKLERNKTAHLKRRFHGTWKGTYRDLGRRELHLLLVEQTRFGNLIEIGTASLTLLEIATGSVQQEVTFFERDGHTLVESYRCHFHMLFQERFTYVLKFVNWSAKRLLAVDGPTKKKDGASEAEGDGGADPFLKFILKGDTGSRKFVPPSSNPAPPCCRVTNVLRRGGFFGRATSTEHVNCTLFPRYAAAKSPIYYYGTRSDLENETLRLEVWDYDMGSSNDLMGFAEVPLRGVLLSGRIEASLVMYDKSGKRRGADPATRRYIQAGHIEGSIEVVSEPAHVQFGDVIKRLPKMTYLAVQVVHCADLMPKKADGTCDPYVTVNWAATYQQTRVIRSTRAPLYEETLYFPTNLNRITAEDLAAKGDVSIHVLHHDPAAPEDIGFAKIALSKITSADIHRIEDGTDVIKTRVLIVELPLKQQGMVGEGKGEIKLRAYFTPALPEEIKVEDSRKGSSGLDPMLEARVIDWRAAIPYRLKNAGRYQVSALDETNTRRFLPTFLAKVAPPREVSDPMAIARMVHCIAFQQDSHLRKAKGNAEELWSSPNYLLDVKKGASEDHAILQCNFFLGLGLDAYLAIGKLPGGVAQHVWVVTREPNGDVRFWETTKGCFYTLPGRWTGLLLDGAAEVSAMRASQASTLTARSSASQGGAQAGKAGGDEPATREEKRSLRAMQVLAQDRAEREAMKKAKELAEAQQKEEALLYQDDDELLVEEAPLNPYETPRDDVDFLGHEASLPNGLYSAMVRKPMSGLLAPESPLRGAADSRRGFSGKGGGAKPEHLERFQGKIAQVKNAVSFTELSEKSTGKPAKKAATPLIDGSGKRQQQHVKKLEDLHLPPVMERIPYDTIEVLVNHENIWANLQGQNITASGFDLEQKDRWLPFIEPIGLVWKDIGPIPPEGTRGKEVKNDLLMKALHAYGSETVEFSEQEFSQFGIDAKEGLTSDDYIWSGATFFMPQGGFVVRPFYSVGRIGPKLPVARLTALRLQLHRVVKAAYMSWRGTRNMRTRWHTRLEPILEEGLMTYEMAACSSLSTDHRAVDKWRGRLLMALPPNHKFVGRAFSFSLTSPDDIVEHLMTNYDYHEQGHKDVSFLFAVQCFPHYGAIASVWIFIGYLVPAQKKHRRANRED